MIGQRIHFDTADDDFIYRVLTTPGAYGTANGRDWFCCTPNGLGGNLGAHSVVEHEDGTITVSPSILVRGKSEWHGFLERGVWREC